TDEFMVTGYDDFFKGQRSPRDCDVAGAATLSMGEEGITIPQNGYLYVFVSNSNTTYPVLFDNFRVSVQHSALLEETHYYPFGLAMAGISHKASGGAVNNYKFNGKEEQKDEFGIGSGLDIYDFGARQYDAQIGRWHSVDPLAETMRRWSPYCFSFNNPLRFIDPDGMSPTDPNDDGMVNYMDVKDKDGKVTRVWDYADNKDEKGNEPNTSESTGLEVGDRAVMQLPGEGEKNNKDKKVTNRDKPISDNLKNSSTATADRYRRGLSMANGKNGNTDWAMVGDGIVTAIGGSLSTVGGVAAVTSGVGTPAGVAGIVLGIPTIGFGLANIIEGLQGGQLSIPSGPFEATDLGFGGDGSIGQVYDIASGGLPKNTRDGILFGYSIYSSNVGQGLLKYKPSAAPPNQMVSRKDNTNAVIKIFYR
ncbi:MAG: RHS repeat-associated core domain-containing protein, partial [Bacteroidetes bacterium]